METLYTHHSNNYACQLRTQGKLNMRPRQLNSFSTAFKKAEFRKARVITQSACRAIVVMEFEYQHPGNKGGVLFTPATMALRGRRTPGTCWLLTQKRQ